MGCKLIMRNRNFCLGVLAGLALVPCAAHAGESGNQATNDPGVWRVGVGANYSEGDYGEPQKTTVVSVPVTLKY